jgi:hypothetical protein
LAPSLCDVSSLGVPAAALSYRVHCPLFHAIVDAYGNVDIAVVCRLPGFQGTAPGYTDAQDFDVFAEIADSGMPSGKMMGRKGGVVEIPNINRQFYWLPRGNTTIDGAMTWLRLLSYRMPS